MVLQEINDFFDVLAAPGHPAVAQGIYYGGIESDLELELYICHENGWTRKPHDPRCLAFTKKRAQEDSSPSLYLSWLKTKLPVHPTVKILCVEQRTHGEFIMADVDGVFVTFDRTTNPNLYAPLGHLRVFSINGAAVINMLQKDLKDGLSPSVFLNE